MSTLSPPPPLPRMSLPLSLGSVRRTNKRHFGFGGWRAHSRERLCPTGIANSVMTERCSQPSSFAVPAASQAQKRCRTSPMMCSPPLGRNHQVHPHVAGHAMSRGNIISDRQSTRMKFLFFWWFFFGLLHLALLPVTLHAVCRSTPRQCHQRLTDGAIQGRRMTTGRSRYGPPLAKTDHCC